ncbi:hypothetical protein [Deinococcus maricopensis]|nr:hypothetical protein [Deinococcus maricopensis]
MSGGRPPAPPTPASAEVRAAVLRGDPPRAWAAYTHLHAPAPADTVWAVRALMLLREEHRAHDLIRAPVGADAPGARAELARILLFLGRPDDALRTLDAERPERLTPLDEAVWWRTRARTLAFSRSYRLGLDHAERAWDALQRAAPDEIACYAPMVLGQVGEFQLYTGDAHGAHLTLRQALARVTDGSSGAPYLHAILVEGALHLARWDDALDHLLKLGAARGACQQYRTRYSWGRYFLAIGDLDRAEREMQLVASAAFEQVHRDLEFWARLTLASLRAHAGDAPACEAALLRAEELLRTLPSKEHHAGFALRRAACLLRLGAPPDATIEDLLTRAHDVHAHIDLPLDAGVALLHQCELYRCRGDAARLGATVTALRALCARLRNPRFLDREFPLLPELRAVLAGTLEGLGPERPVLELTTLGAERLHLAGHAVHIPMRRALEVLAYLTEHGAVPLNVLLADVFGEMSPRAARNYFHQVRHEVAQRLPQVRVLYDAASREYRLETSLRIVWDVAEVRAGRRALGGRLFLPGSGSWWAEQVNAELQAAWDPSGWP